MDDGFRIEPSSPVAHLGESPVWDDATASLIWVDIVSQILHILGPEHRHRQVPLTDLVTAIGLTESAALVGAGRRGFITVDPETGQVQPIGDELDVHPDDRMNDGACDPEGRFWAGSMVAPERAGQACLWVLDRDRTVHTVLEGLTESNGLGWSPAGDAMYFIDTPTQRVDRLTFQADGYTVSSRETFARIPPADGEPDGLAVDADGGIWVALWRGGRVRRFTAGGAFDRDLPVAALNVTNCVFAHEAAHGWRIYVTTALAEDAPGGGGAAAGRLLAAPASVAGLPPNRFRAPLNGGGSP